MLLYGKTQEEGAVVPKQTEPKLSEFQRSERLLGNTPHSYVDPHQQKTKETSLQYEATGFKRKVLICLSVLENVALKIPQL